MGFDLQPDSLVVRPDQLFQPHKNIHECEGKSINVQESLEENTLAQRNKGTQRVFHLGALPGHTCRIQMCAPATVTVMSRFSGCEHVGLQPETLADWLLETHALPASKLKPSLTRVAI
eukprot:1150920-Pelagomonas_calceolata.AAC.3